MTRRVLLIVLDAWRRRVALDDEKMPRTAALAHRGSRGTVLAGVRTYTKPCVRKLMTGLYSNVEDSALNLLSDPVAEESLLSRLNAAGYFYTLVDTTPAFSGLFERQGRPGSILTPSVKRVAWDSEDPAHDARVETTVRPLLDDLRQKFLMIHFEDLDLAGHIYGPQSQAYDRVLRATDDRIARFALALDLQQDTLIVIGDHGTDSLGHHGGADYAARQTAYVAVGAGIKNSNKPWDPLNVSDTLAMLLGVCPPLDSIGAPETDLLAIDGRELKSRCDRCLMDRLGTLPGPMSHWTSTVDARRYFGADSFTPDVALLYRRVASPLRGTGFPWSELALAVATTAMGLLFLWLSRDRTRAGVILIAALAALAFVPFRDSVCVALLAGLVAFVPTPEIRAASLTWIAAAAALLSSPLFANPTPLLDRVAADTGIAVWLAGGVALSLRRLRRSRIRTIGPIALTVLAAAIAARLTPSHSVPGVFSPSTALIDYALTAGCVFLLAGLFLRRAALTAIASLALAGCLFHGWPLLIFALFELSLVSATPQGGEGFSRHLIWAPVGVIALLRTENGGYGFSKIDLSLAVLGASGGAVSYSWGAAVILLAYMLPLLLAIRLAVAMTGRPLMSHLAVLVNVLVVFCGADLLFIAVPALAPWGSDRYEEILMFDIVLCALACLPLGGAAAAALFRKVLPFKNRTRVDWGGVTN